MALFLYIEYEFSLFLNWLDINLSYFKQLTPIIIFHNIFYTLKKKKEKLK